MDEPSTIYFPLRSNASALVAGSSVAAVRRRILVAGLLHDEVVLEDGLHVTWAGESGASEITAHGEPVKEWQSTHRRGKATGARHWVAIRPDNAPVSTPSRAVISTEAAFSWRATFEPFKRELPRSALSWLAFGHVTDDRPAKEIVRAWRSEDQSARFRQYVRTGSADPESFVTNAILKSGYYDLAIAAITGVGLSIDHRHGAAIAQRLAANGASRIGGHYALGLVIPDSLSWDDVTNLRRMKAIAEYRAVIREIEQAALSGSATPEQINDAIENEYRARVEKAAARRLSFRASATVAVVGFVVGGAIDLHVPLAGSALTTVAGLGMTEGANRVLKPRWLSVHRRMNKRPDGV